jgi:transposase
MGCRVSHNIKALIPSLHYEQGYNVKKICILLQIKRTIVYEALSNYRRYGVTHNRTARPNSGRRHLTSTDHTFIRALLNNQHTAYLDEIQEQLLLRRGVKVSLATITRTLRRLHFTHKDVPGRALERNDRHRAVYMNWIVDLVPDPEMLMFGDEASKDERTSNRHKGWARQGAQCVQRKCFVRGTRYSILPIMSLDGIIAHDIIEGSVTSEKFVEFLRELVVSKTYLIFMCYI